MSTTCTDSPTTYTPIPLTPELAPLMGHGSPDASTEEPKKKIAKLLDTPAHVLLMLKSWLGFSQVERWQIEEEEARIMLLGEEEEEDEDEGIDMGEESGGESGSGESDGEVEF
ncbi:uncharacterized protein H6S33_011122 [Morchella sextelata]|jgi:hypothetical protein|uniref:uncharacterized protein n=1 Tax=Morchella sextelata TaxID=1174677 RepID=UPI001D041A37|nr:uncharacterized protein H6S33_011122 [Morchella sextelata]KAH0611857.1 hypothetical protein H6S33_011122 [Morchella sextelata]